MMREAESTEIPVRDICRKHGSSKQTYYRRKHRYGGMNVCDARRLKDLETDNAKLKRLWRRWSQMGLSLPRRRRSGSDIRLPDAQRPNTGATTSSTIEPPNDRTLKLLCVVDEYSRGCLAIEVARCTART
jgi:hypothetical protein